MLFYKVLANSSVIIINFDLADHNKLPEYKWIPDPPKSSPNKVGSTPEEKSKL